MIKCEKCGEQTAISFEEWLSLTTLMLTFSELEKSQRETLMLMVDGMKYRKLQKDQK